MNLVEPMGILISNYRVTILQSSTDKVFEHMLGLKDIKFCFRF